MTLLNCASIAITFVLVIGDNNVGVTCYQNAYNAFVRRELPYFVDKSNLLKAFFNQTEWPYVFVTCPRRFGKTMNLDMIESFAQIEIDDGGNVIPWNETKAYDLFGKLAISKDEETFNKHLAQHPVIRIDLQFDTIDNLTDEMMMVHVRDHLKNTFEKYRWLLDLNTIPENETQRSDLKLREEYIEFMRKGLSGELMRPDVQQSFYRLARILYEYFDQRKVIILVDNYDSAAVHGLSTHKAHVAVFYEWLHEFFTNGLKHGKKYVQYALITGTCGLTYYAAVHEDIDNIWHHPFLEGHDFDGFCGFLEQEVIPVLDHHGCDEKERSDIKTYYGGYATPDGKQIYDPHSFSRYFQSAYRQVRSYWPITERGELMISKFLNFYGVYDLLNKSLSGERTNVTIWGSYDTDAIGVFSILRGLDYKQYFYDEEDCLKKLYTFTLENGYLSHGADRLWYVSPNEQTREVVSQLIAEFVEQQGGLPSTHLPCSYTLDMSFFPFH